MRGCVQWLAFEYFILFNKPSSLFCRIKYKLLQHVFFFVINYLNVDSVDDVYRPGAGINKSYQLGVSCACSRGVLVTGYKDVVVWVVSLPYFPPAQLVFVYSDCRSSLFLDRVGKDK